MLIEPVVLNYLNENMNIPVETEIPKSLPEKFVVFTIVERGRKNFINHVTIEFHSYAKRKLDAAEIDEQVRMLMEDIIVLPEVAASRLSGGNDINDPEIDRYRYRCYFNLTY